MFSPARAGRLIGAIAVAVLLLSGCNSWLQFGDGPQHTGVTPDKTITTSNVGSLHQAWQVVLPHGDVADSAPAYAENVSTSTGKRNLVVVTAKSGDLYAFDAAAGTELWEAQHPPGSCLVNNTGPACFTTGSPAIDPNLQYVYTYSPGDGLVHKHQLATGQEVTGGGWPEVTSLKAFDEKGSSSLTIATFGSHTYLYVTHAGYPGDHGDYQGHVTVIDLATGAQRVWNAVCSDRAVHFVHSPGSPDCTQVQAGVWARGGVVADTDTGRVYLVTGNGDYVPTSHDWGDSVVAINPDGSGGANGNPLDSYTPPNFLQLQSTDTDLGSSVPTPLPAVPGARVAHIGVVGGKDGILRLLDLSNLSGQGGPGHLGGELASTPMPEGGQVLCSPVTWRDAQGHVWIFTTSAFGPTNPTTGLSNGVSALRVSADANGNPVFSTAWVHGSVPTNASPVFTAGGVLFVALNNAIVGYGATTGQGLWLGSLPGGIHWQSPIVGGGRVYVPDQSGHLTAFGL